MGDGIRLADIGEELVAKAFTLGSAFDEAGDVHECEPRRNDLGAARDPGQIVKPRIRHADIAHIGLDGAERIIRRLRRRGLRERVEER